jgi:hypothetical protein
MRDVDIRSALKEELRALHSAESNTLIIDELGLCLGAARVDIAVINGSFSGYEIKSDEDTLERLAGQKEIYCKIFDRMTVVTGERHAGTVSAKVPEWWGVQLAMNHEGDVSLQDVRESRDNPLLDPVALAQLLWRDELIDELSALGLVRGLLSKPRKTLCERFAQSLSLSQVRNIVADRIKARADWRVVR